MLRDVRMGFGRIKLFGSEVERVIGRMHEFTLYKRTTTVSDPYHYSLSISFTGHTGLFGFIQPRFTEDERFGIQGIAELGEMTGYFKPSYVTKIGTDVSLEIADEVLWQSDMYRVMTKRVEEDGRGGQIVRARLTKKVS